MHPSSAFDTSFLVCRYCLCEICCRCLFLRLFSLPSVYCYCSCWVMFRFLLSYRPELFPSLCCSFHFLHLFCWVRICCSFIFSMSAFCYLFSPLLLMFLLLFCCLSFHTVSISPFSCPCFCCCVCRYCVTLLLALSKSTISTLLLRLVIFCHVPPLLVSSLLFIFSAFSVVSGGSGGSGGGAVLLFAS